MPGFAHHHAPPANPSAPESRALAPSRHSEPQNRIPAAPGPEIAWVPRIVRLKHHLYQGKFTQNRPATLIAQKLALALKLMWRKKEPKKAFALKVNRVKCSQKVDV